MFFDEDKIRKMNLGNKKIVKKDEFLKRIKDEKEKEQEKSKIAESNTKIFKFFSKNKGKICNSRILDENQKNLKSIVNLLKMKKDLNNLQKEKIALASLEKTVKDLHSIYQSINIPNSSLSEFTKTILNILDYVNRENLLKFVINNLKLFQNMLISSLINFYIFIKKDYLIDEKITFFLLYQFFILNNLEEVLDPINSYISKNISSIFILDTIVKNSHKILTDISKSLLLKFVIGLNNKIARKRSQYRESLRNDYNYCFSNKIVESFCEASILCYLDYYNLLNRPQNMIDLLSFYTSPVDNNFLIFLNEEKLVRILLDISTAISERRQKAKNELVANIHYNQLDFFNHLFLYISGKLSSNTLLKMNLDKMVILKGINDILELVMEAPDKTKMIDNFISLIYNSGKLIETLYHSSFEKTDFYSILDYIFNKVAVKYSSNSKLIDEILLFSVDVVKESKKGNLNCSEDVLEIISFAILNKIDFKENYCFLEYRATNNLNDIYQNLPFNFLYLNLMSKLLIAVFTNLIYKTNLDEIEKLNQNIIIKCLKGLYMLDSDIEFSPNRETFWTNMELISKFSGYSQIKQLESMKIMPFVFPFTYRLNVMYNYFKNEKRSHMHMQMQYDEEGYDSYDSNLTVSRDHMFDETLNLYLNNRLRPFKRWKITFVDKFGNQEEGVDAGGLYKEFLFKLSEQAFSQHTGFFMESGSGFLMPNPNSIKISPIHLQIFEFLGFICGIGLLEDIKLWPNFSLFFLNNILEVENPFRELKSYDPEIYKNLVTLKNYEGDVENDYGLNFTINEERDGKPITIPLIQNGKDINVTNSNKLLFINKVAQYKLTNQIKEQCEAFRRGLLKVCDEDVLKVFTADEMRQLIYGFDKETIDVLDLKMNTEYEQNWNFSRKTDSDAVQSFWEILEEFDTKEREKFLFFVTSLKRPPLGGFKKLIPRFKLAKSSKEVPTASTCTNMLLLPVLPKNKMREILRYVINADAGFYYG